MSAERRRMRIVICEGSRAYCAALARYLQRDPELQVVAAFASCDELMRGLPGMHADLVIIDIDLPGKDGLHATKCIMGWRGTPIVILSDPGSIDSERTAAALAAGALDAINKNLLDFRSETAHEGDAVRKRVKRLARTTLSARSPLPSVAAAERPHARHAAFVGLVASTGGPAALMTVLSALPADFPLPVLVVQHISDGFAAGLATWLDSVVKLPVRLAQHGQRVGLGVSVAPSGEHLRLVAGGALSLDPSATVGGHRPSADVLLASVAAVARSGAVSVVLTGMGQDGAEGTADVRAAGGLTIAQDEASSVVFGMPRAAATRGAERILPLSEIGPALRALPTAWGSR